MVVQNRCFAALGWDRAVRQVCDAEGVIYQGFSLLTANTEALHDPGLVSIARTLNATPAQVVFRFAIQIGMLPLTGTTNPRHMREDLAAARLTLSAEAMEMIETIAE
jgi:diketogulonate reductase-like aldo/keto reductase